MVTATVEQGLAKAKRSRQAIVVPYLLVDRSRSRRTRALAHAVREAGCAALELGFPFSDPLADGPLLAAAAGRSLRHGTSWRDLVHACREASAELPVAVMTYANPIFHRGIDAALGALAEAGATGLIVPDLDLEDSGPWRASARRQRLALVLLVAPSTPRERVVRIAERSRGFLYAVGRYGTTGVDRPSGESSELAEVVRTAHHTRRDLPVLVGFGVKGPTEARKWVDLGADGTVVGSAFEAAIGPSGDPERARRFVAPIVRAAHPA